MPTPAAQQKKPQKEMASSSSDSTVYEAAGRWVYTVDSPQGGGGTILLKKNGSEYSGTIRRDRFDEEVPLENVMVNKNDVNFSYPVTFGGNTIRVQVQARILKNEMQGTMRMGEMRTFNLTGKRSE